MSQCTSIEVLFGLEHDREQFDGRGKYKRKTASTCGKSTQSNTVSASKDTTTLGDNNDAEEGVIRRSLCILVKE